MNITITIFSFKNPSTEIIRNPNPTVPESDSYSEREVSSSETNYETHSTKQHDQSFEIGSVDSDSVPDTDIFGWKFTLYPTFGTKYPYTDTVEDTTEEASTTEQVDIEDLENQLMNILDKLAERHSN